MVGLNMNHSHGQAKVLIRPRKRIKNTPPMSRAFILPFPDWLLYCVLRDRRAVASNSDDGLTR